MGLALIFSTESTTYVYGHCQKRGPSVYVLIESHPRQDDEPVSPLPTATSGTWTEKKNGSWVWEP